MSHNGIEPLTFRVLSERDNQLHQRDAVGDCALRAMHVREEQLYLMTWNGKVECINAF